MQNFYIMLNVYVYTENYSLYFYSFVGAFFSLLNSDNVNKAAQAEKLRELRVLSFNFPIRDNLLFKLTMSYDGTIS